MSHLFKSGEPQNRPFVYDSVIVLFGTDLADLSEQRYNWMKTRCATVNHLIITGEVLRLDDTEPSLLIEFNVHLLYE